MAELTGKQTQKKAKFLQEFRALAVLLWREYQKWYDDLWMESLSPHSKVQVDPHIVTSITLIPRAGGQINMRVGIDGENPAWASVLGTEFTNPFVRAYNGTFAGMDVLDQAITINEIDDAIVDWARQTLQHLKLPQYDYFRVTLRSTLEVECRINIQVPVGQTLEEAIALAGLKFLTNRFLPYPVSTKDTIPLVHESKKLP
jgi:hypothetical protein